VHDWMSKSRPRTLRASDELLRTNRACPRPTLRPQAPGSGRVQYFMASLLATLVLDKEAMATLQARGEGLPLFRTTLRQLARTLARLKEARAAAAAAAGAAPADVSSARDEADAAPAIMPPKRRVLSAGRHSASEEALAVGAGGSPAPGAMTDAELASAVQLADACAQGVWGSAHYCMTEPLHITQVRAQLPGTLPPAGAAGC
jgi:hypothetical protein